MTTMPTTRERFVLTDCSTYGDDRSWATLSSCGRYRYALGRRWSETNLFTLAVIMLNPSTANHEVNDPTIRKCIHFAKQEGCGALLVRNLFAWRATKPNELRGVENPHGPENHAAIAIDVPFTKHVAAWGLLGPKWLRALGTSSLQQCNAITRPMHVLGLTRSDEPRHPLYLPNNARAVLWGEAVSARLAATR